MAKKNEEKRSLTVTAPKLRRTGFKIRGITPYVQNKFSQKALEEMRATQEAGSTAKKGRKRDPKNFQKLYEGSMHISTEGWHGIPAPAFRNALVSACRLVGFKMTLGKMSVFTEADGFDRDDGTPLVKITKGEPHYHEYPVKNASGVVDIRPRAMWAPGWEATVTVRYDADQFTEEDVANLLMRVGLQVGIGEGRHDSRMSTGMGWGEFELI